MSAYREACKPEEKKMKFDYYKFFNKATMPFVRILKLILFPVFGVFWLLEKIFGPITALLLGYIFHANKYHYFEETGQWYQFATQNDFFFSIQRPKIHDHVKYETAVFQLKYKGFLSRINWFDLFEKNSKSTDEA